MLLKYGTVPKANRVIGKEDLRPNNNFGPILILNT